MNKNIIALAVAAAVAAPMAAQAEATVYGIAQVEIADMDQPGGTTPRVGRAMYDEGTGRIGVKGSEDLGGGLSALYTLEWAVDTTAGGNPSGDRTSTVGLKGSFGTVTFGNQTNPFGQVGLDPLRGTTLQARGSSAETGSAEWGNGSFVDDSIMYTNTFGAVTLYAMMSAADDVDHSGDSGLAVSFKQGPLRIVAASTTDETGPAGATTTRDRTKFGATYDMAGFTFTAQMESDDNAGTTTDYTMLSVAYKMGANTFYARMGSADVGAVSTDHTAVAVTHALSKTTKVWVGTASDDNLAYGDRTSVGMQVKF